MERAPNPNSPEEVRRAMQRLRATADAAGVTVASILADILTLTGRVDDVEDWPAAAISSGQITSWDTAYGWGNWAHTTLDGYGITDATPLAHKTTEDALNGLVKCDGAGTYTAITDNSTAWNSAAGISHAAVTVSALTGITLSGQQLSLTAGYVIPTTTEETNWNSAYGWGNHASAGYLSSQTSHSDVVVDGDFGSQGIMYRGATPGSYSVIKDGKANWDTAYGWGNHAGLYDATGTASGVISTHESTYNHSNYNTAYGWGNHASAGYLTSQTSHADVVVDGDFASQGIMLRGASSGTYSILTDASANWNTAYGWGNHASAGYSKAAIADNVVLSFGTGVDYWFRYYEPQTQFEFWSSDTNGTGTDGIIFTVNDGTDDVYFRGNVGIGIEPVA
ncbi:MAG: hypothetical protein ACYDH4_11945, partial [Candidatus Cryosericum sp.]